MSAARCAAGDYCDMEGLPLPPEGSRDSRHFCLRCGHQKHAPCGHQFDDLRGNEEEYKDILDVIAPKKDGDRPNPKPAGKKGPQLEICFNCVHQIRSSTTTPAAAPAPSPMPVETPATTTTTNSSVQTTARSSASANAADVSAAAAPLPSSTASAAKKSNGGGVVDLTADAPKKKKSKQTKLKPPSGGKRKEKPPKPRKERTNYSIQKRLEILEYKAKYGGGPAVRKYKCSRQNLSYWEQQKAEYLNVVNHSGNKNRIVKNDPLLRIKIGISAFYELNKTMPKDCQINITGEVISARAIVIRDRLLEIHAESNFLTDHEVTQMKKCTFSQSWSNKLARSNGWKSKKLHGEAGSVDVDKAAPEIERICTLIAEYDLDHVYNMDETGLFFKCLPNRSYLKKEDYKNARGNKLMKAKDRVTVYVCTNADGSDKVPLAMIGKSKEPRCFLRRQKKLTYYSQRRAWSDTVTFHKWWRMFLHHIRRRTTKKVLLILDNCGPHGDELIDPEGQVTVVFLPPNCTSMFQPMDAGVIAMLKKNYRTQLLLIMLQTFDDREHRRSQAKGMAAGTKGLDEGHHPHLRDAMDILYKVWEEVKPEAVKKCWIKSQLIGRDDITSLSAIAPGNDSVDSEAVADAATTTDADGDVNMEPEVVAAAGDDSETSDGDDAEMERLYELANQFAKDNNDRQRCLDNMSDYDVMINELVMTMKSTPPEDAQKMMRDWMNMEENDYCRELQREEVSELLEDCDLLLDLQNEDDEIDDAEGEVEDQQAPKVPPKAERLREMAAQVKQLSIEVDGFEEEIFAEVFGEDFAQDLSDLSNIFLSKCRLFEAKKLEKKLAGNKLRQPNVAPYFRVQKAASKPYSRHDNAYWLLDQCKKHIKDSSETPLLLAEAALDAIKKLRENENAGSEEDDENDDEDDDADARYNIFFNSFGHLRSRNVELIMVLNSKSDELVKDLSLTLEQLKLTWEHEDF